MTSHSAFGLSIRSNCAVPGLVVEAAHGACDVQFWLDPVAATGDDPHESWYVADGAVNGEVPPRVWRTHGDTLVKIRYADGTEFHVDHRGCEVRGSWIEPSTLEDTATYLLGPIIGLVLQLRGVACLHASAIAVGGQAIALVGPQGAGKSTTAAGFALRQFPVLADDIVALSDAGGAVRVVPAYPQIRLWPDSVASLYGSADSLPRLTPSWDKRALALAGEGYRFAPEPLRLAAIYELAGRTQQPDPLISERRGREALLALLANSYTISSLDTRANAAQFEVLARLVSRVPVRRVIAGNDLAALPRLCSAILTDCESLTCTA